jgi:glutaredoxin-like YruB-family protein
MKNMNKIKVYSTSSCSYCVALKFYLKSHNIEFENIDISSSQELQNEMIEKSGQYEVPVLDINGQIILGFDKNKIDKLLDIK